MDMKEWIIIGGTAMIGLIVLHGLFMAWWRSRDPLRMKIQPGLLPEELDDDDWPSAELPNGGARVVSVDALIADGANSGDAGDGIPVLLETADPLGADGVGMAAEPIPAAQAEDSEALAESPLPSLAPIVPERRLRPVREEGSMPSIRVEADQDEDEDSSDVGRTGGEADAPSLEEAAFVDSEFEAMPEGAAQMPEPLASFDDSDQGAEVEVGSPVEDAVDDLLVIHLVASRGKGFGGYELVEALRAQDLRFGDMDIFHRIDAVTGDPVFSVVRAVEPGSFDLNRIEDCASPGLMVFLQLRGRGDAQAALEDMMRTAEAIAGDLDGELLDERRQPFAALSAEGYRSRAMGLAGRQVAHGAR